jgi:hypothetical protein
MDRHWHRSAMAALFRERVATVINPHYPTSILAYFPVLA